MRAVADAADDLRTIASEPSLGHPDRMGLLIAVAGAVGALARWCLAEWTRGLVPGVPGGALVVNVLGCLLFGFLAHHVPVATSPQVKACLLVGFLGAFTTFSSYVADVVEVVEQGRLAAALVLVAAHNGLGLAAFVLGARLAR